MKIARFRSLSLQRVLFRETLLTKRLSYVDLNVRLGHKQSTGVHCEIASGFYGLSFPGISTVF